MWSDGSGRVLLDGLGAPLALRLCGGPPRQDPQPHPIGQRGQYGTEAGGRVGSWQAPISQVAGNNPPLRSPQLKKMGWQDTVSSHREKEQPGHTETGNGKMF